MSEIGLYVFTVGAAFSFLCFIARTGGDGKTMRSALGIILIAATVSPLCGLISDGVQLDFGLDAAPTPDGAGYAEYMEEAMREGIELALRDRFSLSADDVEVRVIGFDSEKMRCEKCVVKLSGVGIFADLRGIEQYCLECGADKCDVVT